MGQIVQEAADTSPGAGTEAGVCQGLRQRANAERQNQGRSGG